MFAYILLSLCLFLLYRFRKRRDYWKNRNVPHEKGGLIFGNLELHPMKFNVMLKKYGDIYKRFKGYKYCGIISFGKPALMVLDPDLIEDILVKNFASFHDNYIEASGRGKSIMSKYLFFTKGEYWKQLRNQQLEYLTAAKVKNAFPRTAQALNNFQRYLEKKIDAAQNTGLNAYELGMRFNVDFVSTSTSSPNGKSFTDRSRELTNLFYNMIDNSFFNRILYSIDFVLPEIRKIKAPSLLSLEFTERFESFISEEMKAQERDGTSPESSVDCMTGYYMTLLTDAIGTSTASLHYALYEVAANPHVQKKLQEECDGVLSKHEGNLTHDALQEMTYLNLVVMESVRKHPPIIFIARSCTRAIKLPPVVKGGGEILLEEGVDVIIPDGAIHCDPQYYPEPDKFDPCRFAEEAKRSRPKYAFLGFGGGPRICLGQRFAVVQMKAAIVSILSKFDVRVNEKTATPLETDPEEYENLPKGGIWLNFYRRDTVK